jgi:F0F1-type ATP synthase delta subunit
MVEVTGKQVQIIEKTDPNLLGGIVVDIGSNRFDGSLRTQLETLKRDITNA